MAREKENKSFHLELKDINDTTGEVVFVFATPSKDLDGEIIKTKTAYTKTIKENIAHIYHNRDHRESCGKVLSIQVEGTGELLCKSRLALKTIVGRDTYEQYKAETVMGHSQEFETIKESYDGNQKARVIEEVALWGVTTVTTIPANLNTHIISLKSFAAIEKQLKSINDLLHNGHISDKLGIEFTKEYIRLKNFMNTNKDMLKQLGIIHCTSCSAIINPDDITSEGKCPDCGKFLNNAKSKSLLTSEFVNKADLFT